MTLFQEYSQSFYILSIFILLLYNSFLAIKLIYDTFTGKVEKDKIIWNLISSLLIFTGTLLMFFWIFRRYIPTIGWDVFIGIILLFVNNLVVTILAFMNRIKASRIAKIGNVIFTLFALVTMMQYLQKISALTPFILPQGLGWLTLIPSVGYAQFQTFFFGGSIGYFYPTWIFIPIAVPIKFRKKIIKKKDEVAKSTSKKGLTKTKPIASGRKSISEQKKQKRNVFLDKDDKAKPEEVERISLMKSFRHYLDNAIKTIYGAVAIFILVFAIFGISTMTSFNPYTSADYLPIYPDRADFEFGVSLKSVSLSTINLSDYQSLLLEELDLMSDLGVTVARLDVRMELIDNFTPELNQTVASLKARGFKIMLSAYGYAYPSWQYTNVSFVNYAQVIHDQSIQLVEYYEPDYLLVYPEPLEYSSYYIADLLDTDSWVSEITNTTDFIHSISTVTKVGVNLLQTSFDSSLNLFQELWENSTLDFIGLDNYIGHAQDLDISSYLDLATNNSKEFWMTEFGLSPLIYGERAQAGAMAGMLENCLNNDIVKGFVFFSLLDDFYNGNTLGLVTETGYRRLAFTKYQEIIAEVLG